VLRYWMRTNAHNESAGKESTYCAHLREYIEE
jgi:hypothetical protein